MRRGRGGSGKGVEGLDRRRGVQLDIYFLPGANDVCILTAGRAEQQRRVRVRRSRHGHALPGHQGEDLDIKPGRPTRCWAGCKLGNIRLFASLDYALSHNMLLGLRAGYVFRTDPVAAPPSRRCISKRASPISSARTPSPRRGSLRWSSAGVGAGEFDAFVPVTVINT